MVGGSIYKIKISDQHDMNVDMCHKKKFKFSVMLLQFP